MVIDIRVAKVGHNPGPFNAVEFAKIYHYSER